MFPTPTLGRIVHYVRPGSADGQFPPGESVAIITGINNASEGDVALYVINRNGVYHNDSVLYDQSKGPTTWHWPERDDV